MISKCILLLVTFFSLSVSADPEDLYREPAETPAATPEATVNTPTADAAATPKTDEQIAEEESAKVRRDAQPNPEEVVKKEDPVEDKKLDQAEIKENTTDQKQKPKAQKVPKRHVVLLGEVAALTTWVPLKYGGSLTVHFTNDLAIETNYMNGKISGDTLGFDAIDDIKENRLDVLLRYYTGKTFSIFAGYSMQETETKLSTKTTSENINLPFTSTNVNAQGVTMGISSRWQWKSGFTMGLDWLSVFLPLSTSVDNDFRKEFSSFSDQQAYKDIEDTYEKIEDYPRLSILELGLGWTW